MVRIVDGYMLYLCHVVLGYHVVYYFHPRGKHLEFANLCSFRSQIVSSSFYAKPKRI